MCKTAKKRYTIQKDDNMQIHDRGGQQIAIYVKLKTQTNNIK
jgi:hypothetical protein